MIDIHKRQEQAESNRLLTTEVPILASPDPLFWHHLQTAQHIVTKLAYHTFLVKLTQRPARLSSLIGFSYIIFGWGSIVRHTDEPCLSGRCSRDGPTPQQLVSRDILPHDPESRTSPSSRSILGGFMDGKNEQHRCSCER